MIVRLEKIRKTNSSLVIDEVGRLLGKIREDLFIDCMENKDILIEDDYTYFYVNKNILTERMNKL